jgi:hypothetical protein
MIEIVYFILGFFSWVIICDLVIRFMKLQTATRKKLKPIANKISKIIKIIKA